MKNKTAIQRAIDFFGNDVQLANAMNITPQAVGKWKRSKVPAERCLELEEKTEGNVTRYQLRPDVFGKVPTAA